MEKNRNVKIYVIFALVISVMGLSIAYAAYSATLLISGTVTAKKSSDAWNVHFESTDGSTTLTPTLGGNAKVTWKVQKEGLTAKTNTVTMDKNYSEIVDLNDNTKYTFKLVSTPESAVVSLKCGETEVNGFGTQSCDVDKNTTIEYSVTKAGYYDKSGSYTIETSDYTLNVTLEEKPWITGTYLNTSSTLAAAESLTVYHSGKYLIDIGEVKVQTNIV